MIPTAGRPEYLPRAVASALAGMAAGDVEVLVVPNGPDASWQSSLAPWAGNAHVRIYPLTTPNQNIARNHGIAHARGKFMRFLDDDDYLLPEAAAAQYSCIDSSNADVCSGPALVEDEDQTMSSALALPDTPDFLLSALSPRRLQLPFAHVYRRSSLENVQWPPEILRSEDIAFLIRYAVAAPRVWCKVDPPVGVWFQHRAPRMSLAQPDSGVHETTASELLAAYESLVAQRRMTEICARTVAEALWECVHRGFYLRPRYWSSIAAKAMNIDPEARPETSTVGGFRFEGLNPLWLHWAAIPSRLSRHVYRTCRARLRGWDYRRTL